MQGHRFDSIVQALVRQTSRRDVLRGAVAMLSAGALSVIRDATGAAHHSGIALGGACRHNNQCLNHAVTTRRRGRRRARQGVFCLDNGFAYDGPLNCCHYGGGSCTRDEHCCGSRHFCRNRICTFLR